MENYILEMKNITKEFPGVKALDDVTFSVKEGEIHALVGENGAGKSTLMKVLSGVHSFGTYKGDIVVDNQVQKYHHIKDSEKAGIGIIYQELTLVKEMNVCENIFLGSELHSNGRIDWDKSMHEAKKWLAEVKLNIDPVVRVLNLGVGQQQLIEIAKALSKNVKILILDEPTAALTNEETKLLLNIIRNLKTKGVTCIYISHRLNEVFDIADRITVLRDGKTIVTENKSDLNEQKLIAHMVGRELTQLFPKKKHTSGEVVLEVKDWTIYSQETDDIALDNINFQVKRGEILGIAGLVGAGRSELMMSIFGAWGKRLNGDILLNNKRIKIHNPHQAIKAGISLVTEDRKRYGLVLEMNIEKNTTLASLDKVSAGGFVINKNEEVVVSNKYVQDLAIKTPSVEQLARNLSGGNQQKVVLGKWLMTEPQILILDEPTRGIDVGAKYEIYNIMNDLIEQGVCVVMISSELPEILGMSDRILVMHEGKITGEMLAEEATQEKVMLYATGNQ
ncbi:MAG: xylose ABC transporter ATP-binding protein [Spirochaetes bacterium]|nr:xylose ABC transporter ATP-binding protein [Spirochaetota bacterium]